MDETVLKQGDYSKGNTNYRVDYGDAHLALEPYVQDGGNIVLPLASHTETCEYGKRFAEGFKDGNLVHVARTVQEDGAFVDEIATATAEARLSVGLMLESPPDPTHAFIFADNADSYSKVSNWGVTWESDGALEAEFAAADLEADIFLVGGLTGTGKSTRCPLAFLKAFAKMQKRGIAHMLPKKIAAESLAEWYGKQKDTALRTLPQIWNGESKTRPRQTPFVMLVTPVSLFHRLRYAESWSAGGVFG